MEGAVQQHLTLCEETYRLLLWENRELRSSGGSTPETILQEKQELLGRLAASNDTLRSLNKQPRAFTQDSRQRVRSARNLCLKILLLDRDNEDLLLRNLMRQD